MSRFFPPEPSEHVTTEEFRQRFRQEWNELDHLFFKVERLQRYEEPGDVSFEAFRSGDFRSAAALVRQRMRDQKPLYDDIHRKGIRWARVRIVEFPLSDYLAKYELVAYEESSKLGEEIRFLN